VSFVVTI